MVSLSETTKDKETTDENKHEIALSFVKVSVFFRVFRLSTFFIFF